MKLGSESGGTGRGLESVYEEVGVAYSCSVAKKMSTPDSLGNGLADPTCSHAFSASTVSGYHALWLEVRLLLVSIFGPCVCQSWSLTALHCGKRS